MGLGWNSKQQANEFYKNSDRKRQYKSEKRSLEVEKKKRKWKTKDKAATEENAIQEEGPTYGPGEF